jgi:DNA polymerase-3 subunit alpha
LKTGEQDMGYAFAVREEWPDAAKLEKEKEVLGVYVSAQPLDSYLPYLAWLPMKKFKEASNQQGEIIGCGVVRNIKVVTTKAGDKMAFVMLEDPSGNAEIVVFPKIWQRVALLFEQYTVFMVKGMLGASNDQLCKIRAHDILPFDTLLNEGRGIEKITINFKSTVQDNVISAIKNNSVAGTISLEFIFQEQGKQLSLIPRTKIGLTNSLCKALVSHDIDVRFKLL